MKKIVNLQELLNKNKIIPHYLDLKDKDTNTLPPIAVEYHWCATCNYNCIHCSYAQRRKSKECLTQEVVSQSVQDLIKLGVKAVYFSGGGEPTTFKNWDSYAKTFLDSDVETALITNSALLKENHFETLRRFNYIAVSVYSTDETQYKKITGSNVFEKQFALPKLLKTPDTDLILGARCVIDSINYQNIFNIYQKAIESGFDYIIFIPAVDYEKNEIGLTEEQKKCVLTQIDDNIDKINSENTNLLKMKENGISHYKKIYLDKITNCTTCSSINLRSNAFINYDGNVYLCQPLIGKSEYSIGNINNKPFSDLWNGEKHLEVIKKLNEKFINGDCENCRAIGYNIAINDFNNSIENTVPIDNFV